MTRARALLGPLIVAAGVWCAAGDLAPAAASASVRVAVPAPGWIFVVALAGATLVPGWRVRPATALPAVLSTVPWWPVPLPVIALLWTGPLAWLPVAAAFVAAAGGGLASAARAAVVVVTPNRAPAVAAALSLVIGVAAAWSLAPRLPGGDEPHYLVITQSLLADADLRIENNHVNRDYEAYYGGTIAPDYLARGQDGEIYSIHAPGVSALVAPAFAAFGYRGAQATILLLAVLTAGLIWRAGYAATGDAGAAWFGWAAVALSSTFVIQSVTIFPDGPGALAVSVATWMLVRRPAGPAGAADQLTALAVTGTLLALLPWLHTRFVVLAAGLGLAMVWRLWRAGGVGRTRALASFLAAPAASALLWFGFFWVVYGTPSPTAPYGAAPETSWAFVPGGLLGLFFDQQFGLFVATPVLLAALAGATGRGGAARRWALGIALLYFAVVCTYWMWWAGRPASPARFTSAALPLLAVPVAWAWHQAGARARSLWLGALGVSVTVTSALVFVARGALGWNDRTADALLFEWLSPVVDLPRGLPSFFQALDPERVGTVWVYAAHVALAAVLAVVTVTLALAVSRRTTSRDSRRLSLVAVALAGLMLVVQAGWRFNRVFGVDAVRAQVALISASRPGAPVWRIGPWQVGRVDMAASGLRLVPEAPGRTAAPTGPAVFVDLPPMLAGVSSGSDRLGGDRVEWRVGRTGEWLQSDPVALPAGAGALWVQPSDATLTPESRLPDVGGRAASAVTGQSNGRTIFLLDGNVFIEENAFWVRGGTTAGLVWQMPPGSEGVLRLTLRNGAVDNDVRVRLGGVWQTHAMEPSEAMTLEVPVVDGVAMLDVESPAGFRPSEVSGGEDRRYLGVWIGPR